MPRDHRRTPLIGPLVLLTALAAGCGADAAGEAEQVAAPRPSASAEPSPAGGTASADPADAGLPRTCAGGAAEAAVAPHVEGLPFDETATSAVLSCQWGAADSGPHLFVQFQSGATFADPEGADPEAEGQMGVYRAPEAADLGGKLQYVDLGSVGRSAVLYLPGVSVTANAVGMDLGQDELVGIAIAAAGDLP
ncbi:hypothetical protein DEF23_21135 [Marinitenerispora sediminis]|uniref:DUF3558 domain-containing protein n=2 Tax=Marinitenerispora sediminis TaxID=1931232 RepID=A0A368T0U2_9ACTN|nr:hypothetical protein DEF28_19430 [Marinitenerispora sediminis]RCV51066.1 hypothetical protein DEF23_21135 [Marinitenerispora sediminis]RCV53326.1 hypothetical protein DEF24_20815 [Marinitenerispora sediminis]